MALSANCMPRIEVLGHRGTGCFPRQSPQFLSPLGSMLIFHFFPHPHTHLEFFTISFLAILASCSIKMVSVLRNKLGPILYSHFFTSIVLCKPSISYTESCSSSGTILSLSVPGVLSVSHLSDTDTCIVNTAPLVGCPAPSLGVF